MRAQGKVLSWALVISCVAISGCVRGESEQSGVAEQAAEEEVSGDGTKEAPPNEGGCGGPESTCIGLALGDGTECESHASLQSAAEDACAAEGLTAVDIAVPFDCEGAASSFAKVMCCASGAPGEVPSEPPAPGGPEPAGSLGDGATCLTNGAYAAMAADACASMGMAVVDLYTANDCSADESRYAKYVCGP